MTQLQEKALEMFKWFHELCREGIQYYALGGTALGAVRHQGFIPWDDDIDVGIPRSDYERLKELASTLNDSRYVIETPGAKDFVYPYIKVYDTTTTLMEHNRYNTKRGVFIDVFPLDGIGNTEKQVQRNFYKVDRWYNFFCARVCAFNTDRALYKNIAIVIARCIPNIIMSDASLISKIEKLSKRCEYDECTYVTNYVGAWHDKEIMKREWFGEGVMLPFEDTVICCPKYSDMYLSRMYGDYMQLPPEEKRVTHHDYVMLDMNTSYLV